MVKLHDPILDGGIAFTSYFNGRILSGEDLARDLTGHREARRLLGRALGEGVAFGLEVAETPGQSTPRAPIVTIRPGVALNRQGQALSLRSPVDLRLVRGASVSSSGGVTTFTLCDDRHPGVYVVGDGVYVLTMACAEGREGRAPVSGLGNIAASCNARSNVEGVMFRLIKPPLDPALLEDEAKLRNRLAALSFGLADLISARIDPMAPPPDGGYGLADALRSAGALTDCDVPLALIHWTPRQGITFVDLWSVRRPIVGRGADARWPWLVGERARAEAEALFLQFQAQVDEIAASGEDASRVAAADRFGFLPPLGMLPLRVGTRAGFDMDRFFGDRISRDIAYMDAHLLRVLLQESFSHPPIDVGASDRIQLYLIHENARVADVNPDVTPVVVFASGTLPYRGVARYGVARWDRSRFAPRVI